MEIGVQCGLFLFGFPIATRGSIVYTRDAGAQLIQAQLHRNSFMVPSRDFSNLMFNQRLGWYGKTNFMGRSIIASCLSSCLLGYNDPDVTAAVVQRVQNGSMCTLNNPEEVELAQLLIKLHPWADKVRFARCGGEIMAVAVRIARAKTGRDLVAICGYHGWHDWYLSANWATGNLDGHLLPGLAPKGVPSQLAKTTLPFSYIPHAAIF